jgi:hypothetical protein
MKSNCLAVLAFAAIVFMSCVTMGNGTMLTDERTLSSFEKIAISGSSEVRFHSSAGYRAVVAVDSNLNEYFETVVINNTLKIRPKPGGAYRFTKNVVDVYCPAVSAVSISGSGTFEAVDTLLAPAFRATISGYGKINGETECDAFFAEISGSGDITILGSSNDVAISISGSGNFRGSDFKAKNCSIKINGSGEADVFVEEALRATISGSGTIAYRGNPRIDFRGSGSGRITSLE